MNHCIDCGSSIVYGAKRCPDCYHKKQRVGKRKDGLMRCSKGEDCLHPDGPWLPETEEYFAPRKGKLYCQCRACHSHSKVVSARRNKESADKRRRRYVEKQIAQNPEWERERYFKNRESILERSARWQKDNPEKANARNHRSYQRHREKKLAWQRQYYAEHPEKRYEHQRHYYEGHIEHIKAYNAEYNQRPETKIRKLAAVHRRRNRMNQNGGTFTPQDIKTIYEEQDGRCAYCGIRLFDEHHIDHIVPLYKGGTNWPENLALTCPECNLSKGSKTLQEWYHVRGW